MIERASCVIKEHETRFLPATDENVEDIAVHRDVALGVALRRTELAGSVVARVPHGDRSGLPVDR
jgi:hypothetical protein